MVFATACTVYIIASECLCIHGIVYSGTPNCRPFKSVLIINLSIFQGFLLYKVSCLGPRDSVYLLRCPYSGSPHRFHCTCKETVRYVPSISTGTWWLFYCWGPGYYLKSFHTHTFHSTKQNNIYHVAKHCLTRFTHLDYASS